MENKELEKGFTYEGQKDRTPRGSIQHLRFVISDFIYDPVMQEECAFVVNMTSLHNLPNEDKSCVLDESDHPAIEHPSYILYKEAKRIEKSYILNGITRGEFIPKGKMSPELLAKIQQGAIDSLDTPDFLEDYQPYF